VEIKRRRDEKSIDAKPKRTSGICKSGISERFNLLKKIDQTKDNAKKPKPNWSIAKPCFILDKVIFEALRITTREEIDKKKPAASKTIGAF